MKIKLPNVRLSFPSVFQKASFNGVETKYEATFLLSKKDHADLIASIQAEIKKKVAEDLKGAKLGADKICLRDGDETEYEGYAGHLSLKASNKKRPMVLNKDKTPLTEDDNVIYGGCYVNMMVEVPRTGSAHKSRLNAKKPGGR